MGRLPPWAKYFRVETRPRTSPTGIGTFSVTCEHQAALTELLRPSRSQSSLPITTAPSRARQRLKAGDVVVSMTSAYDGQRWLHAWTPSLDSSIGSTGTSMFCRPIAVGTSLALLLRKRQTRSFDAAQPFVQGGCTAAIASARRQVDRDALCRLSPSSTASSTRSRSS